MSPYQARDRGDGEPQVVLFQVSAGPDDRKGPDVGGAIWGERACHLLAFGSEEGEVELGLRSRSCRLIIGKAQRTVRAELLSTRHAIALVCLTLRIRLPSEAHVHTHTHATRLTASFGARCIRPNQMANIPVP